VRWATDLATWHGVGRYVDLVGATPLMNGIVVQVNRRQA
jgi:hypothetical protein